MFDPTGIITLALLATMAAALVVCGVMVALEELAAHRKRTAWRRIDARRIGRRNRR